MARLEIVTWPDPRLLEESREVDRVDEETRQLIADMAETMYAAPGAGLAAPQVGVNKRVIICDVSPKDQPRKLIALINPEIVDSSEETISIEEGCLSCPDIQVEIPRAAWIKVQGLDPEGRPTQLEAEELLSIVLQHEIDHLSGRVIVDSLSPLKRGLYRRKRRKNQDQDAPA